MDEKNNSVSLRLAPLTKVAPSADAQKQVLTLAANGNMRLYVHVKTRHMVYADKSQPQPVNVRRAGSDLRHHIREARRRTAFDDLSRGLPVILSPEPHPEVTYLALETADVRRFMIEQVIRIHWFHSGLRDVTTAVPEHERHQEPVMFPSPLCLRPEGDTAIDGPWRGEPDEYTYRYELCDLFVENDALAKSKPLPAKVRKLEEASPGVFILFCAAVHFYGAEGAEGPVRSDVMRWLQTGGARTYNWKDYEKLLTEANARLAYKFLKPKRTPKTMEQQKSQAEQTNFDAAILDRAKAKYGIGDYVSDYLAMIGYAADRWRSLEEESENHPPKKGADGQLTLTEKRRLDQVEELREDLMHWGFVNKSEQNAIIDYAIWPIRIVDLKAALRPSKSL